MSKMIAKSLPLSLFALSLFASGSFAATATDNLQVTATVTNNCLITTTPVAFGNYDPILTHASTALEGEGAVTITCTDDSAAAITLGQGANAEGTSSDSVPLRQMNSAGSLLKYALYQEGTLTTVWGNDAGSDLATTGTGEAQEFVVYGEVGAGQNVPAGSYSDTVIATVTF